MRLEWVRPSRSLFGAELLLRLVLVFVAYLLPDIFVADVDYYLTITQKLSDGLPYRDFVWEYPPLTLPALFLGPMVNYDLSLYRCIIVGSMVAFEWGSLQVLRRAFPDRFLSMTVFWTFSVVPLSLLAWFRFDFFPVFLTTVGLVALLQGRRVWHWILLGFLAKLWPVLLGVSLLARRRYKELAIASAAVVVATILWFVFSPDGFRDFLHYRKGAGFQIESLPGAVLHHFGREIFFQFGTNSVSDEGWKWLQPVMFGGTLVAVLALTAIGFLQKPDRRDDVMLIGACVVVMLVLSRIISTQFLVWLAPFIALRAREHVMIALTYFLVNAMSVVMLVIYKQLDEPSNLATLLVVGRNVVLVGLAVAMVRAAVWPPVRSAAAEQPRPQSASV